MRPAAGRILARFAMARTARAPALALVAALVAVHGAAHAQDVDGGGPRDGGGSFGLGPCPADTIGCARAGIAYRRREGLPAELDVDTGWVPSSAPVAVRFRAVVAGHTTVEAAGTLEGAWPEALTLRAIGTPQSGYLESDWGVQIGARLRLHLSTRFATFDWEGNVPYVPRVDMRATAATVFDPWAWDGARVTGRTMRQHIADVPLTEALIPIPGISGGLSFDAQVEVTTLYRSTRITFGMAADPITASTERVRAMFSGGPQAEFLAQLEGRVEHTLTVRIYPSVYVSLLGARWMLGVGDIPVNPPAIGSDWVFDPARAVLLLPDVRARGVVVDFGEVPVGATARREVEFDSLGRADLWVASPPSVPGAAFAFPVPDAIAAPRTTAALPVEFRPMEAGAMEQRVTFRTNDPDTPEVTVTLRGTGVLVADAGAVPDAGEMGDAGDGGDGGLTSGHAAGSCGCSTPGSAPGARAWAAMALAVGLTASRRRRGH
jgi:MYXO-CTERM domain-containing protein